MAFIEVFVAASVLIVIAAFFSMAGRTALALLVSPSIYSLVVSWPLCKAIPTFNSGSCIINFAAAPLATMLGPIAHDDEAPPSPYTDILLIALTLVIAWTVIVVVVKRYKGRRVSK